MSKVKCYWDVNESANRSVSEIKVVFNCYAGLAAAALSGNYLLMTSVLKDLKMMSA